MSKRRGFAVLLLTGSLSLGCVGAEVATTPAHPHKSAKKQQPQLAPLPSGPQGPVPQLPLDTMTPVQHLLDVRLSRVDLRGIARLDVNIVDHAGDLGRASKWIDNRGVRLVDRALRGGEGNSSIGIQHRIGRSGCGGRHGRTDL